MPVHTSIPPPEVPKDFEGPAALDESQQKLYDAVLEHFSAESYVIPNTEKGELLELEKFWLVSVLDCFDVKEGSDEILQSRECILRYLRATKWKGAAAAITRLEVTLAWRREYGVYTTLTPEFVEPEVSMSAR